MGIEPRTPQNLSFIFYFSLSEDGMPVGMTGAILTFYYLPRFQCVGVMLVYRKAYIIGVAYWVNPVYTAIGYSMSGAWWYSLNEGGDIDEQWRVINVLNFLAFFDAYP
jgi:hypothetical protein